MTQTVWEIEGNVLIHKSFKLVLKCFQQYEEHIEIKLKDVKFLKLG